MWHNNLIITHEIVELQAVGDLWLSREANQVRNETCPKVHSQQFVATQDFSSKNWQDHIQSENGQRLCGDHQSEIGLQWSRATKMFF